MPMSQILQPLPMTPLTPLPLLMDVAATTAAAATATAVPLPLPLPILLLLRYRSWRTEGCTTHTFNEKRLKPAW